MRSTSRIGWRPFAGLYCLPSPVGDHVRHLDANRRMRAHRKYLSPSTGLVLRLIAELQVYCLNAQEWSGPCAEATAAQADPPLVYAKVRGPRYYSSHEQGVVMLHHPPVEKLNALRRVSHVISG